MPEPPPHRFEVDLTPESIPLATGTSSSGPAPAFVCGPPPAFEGSDAWWSPEQLQLVALGSCHMTTLLAIARRSRLVVHDYRYRVEGVVERLPEGFRFTSFTLHVSVTVDEAERLRAARVLEKAERHCIITNALRVPVKVDAEVRGDAGAPRAVRSSGVAGEEP